MRIRSFMLAGVSLALAATAAFAADGTVYFRGTDTFGARQARDAAPKLAFAPATGLLLGGTAISGATAFTGPNQAFRLTATGGEIRVCAASGQCGGWGTSGSVMDGDSVQARRTGPTVPGQTVQVEVTGLNLKATFDATARSSAPSLGSFASKTVSSDVVAESALSTFTGWISTRLTVSGGEARVCSSQGACGSWSASSDVKDGDQVQLRGTAGSFGTTKTVTASAGGATATFDIATRTKDTVPDAIAFGPAATGLEPGATAASTIVTLAGFDDAPISVTGGSYALNGGSWTTAAGTAKLGDKVQIRTTGGSFGETKTATLDVGGVKASFAVIVRTKDTTPDAFALGTGPTGVEPGSTSTSNQVTLAGFDDAPVTVSGTGATYSLNGAAYTTASGTAKAGDIVRVQLTAGTFAETRSATLNVGGVTAAWNSTVRAKDTTPDAIANFTTLTSQTAGATVTSDVRQLNGHDGVTVTVSGSGATVRSCTTSTCSGGTQSAFATSATVTSGQYVQLQTTVGVAGSAAQSISLTYGGQNAATWSVQAGSTGSYVGTYALATLSGYSSYGAYVSSSKDLAFVPVPPGTKISTHDEYRSFCESRGFDQNMSAASNAISTYTAAGNYNTTNYYTSAHCSFLGSGNRMATAMINLRNFGLPTGTPIRVFDRGCGAYSNTFAASVNTTDTIIINENNTFSYAENGYNYGQEKSLIFGDNVLAVCQKK